MMNEKQFEETGDMCIYHKGRWEFDDEKRIVDTIEDIEERLAPIVVEMPYSDDGSECYQMDRISVLHLLNRLWSENEQLKKERYNLIKIVTNGKRISYTGYIQLEKENEQLRNELQQIKEYLQIKIDECKNHKKMKEIVFGVEQAVGYEKALLQFQKGLKRRLNNE